MYPSSKPKTRSLLGLLVVGLLGLGFWQWQSIADWWVLNYYQPDPEIAAFAERTKMTDKGKAIFYFAQPKLDNKNDFNVHCQTLRGDLEIGCFRNWRIYVLRITNPELAPVMDETAAHEMLHAAYARLSSAERKRIDVLVDQQAALIKDKELEDLLKKYQITEPGQRTNELHSFLGTQFGNLMPELERYYARYFIDRTAVVAAHQAYELAFDRRKADLDFRLAEINSLKAQLNSLNAQMDAYLRSGNVSAYNSLVPRQNSLVRTLKQKINEYNQLVDEFNSLSASLDSQQIAPENIQER